MFKFNYSNDYKVIHLAKELVNYTIVGTKNYIKELYRYTNSRTGFIYINLGNPTNDFNISERPPEKTTLVAIIMIKD